jgi:4-carboxymuconolactone decarboxylase
LQSSTRARDELLPGVRRGELVEVITHLAFYSGWPTANSAVAAARRVFEDAGV